MGCGGGAGCGAGVESKLRLAGCAAGLGGIGAATAEGVPTFVLIIGRGGIPLPGIAGGAPQRGMAVPLGCEEGPLPPAEGGASRGREKLPGLKDGCEAGGEHSIGDGCAGDGCAGDGCDGGAC